MGVILLEAATALVLLVLIVWWTMFSGRDKGEPRRRADARPASREGQEGGHGDGDAGGGDGD